MEEWKDGILEGWNEKPDEINVLYCGGSMSSFSARGPAAPYNPRSLIFTSAG
ncbi:MAG: hypothetical protein AB9834_05770 [Lentimicrobium sp.]